MIKEFTDVIEIVEAIKRHPRSVIPQDDIESDPPTLGFLSDDNVRFTINIEDFQKSLKEHAPNNRKVVLFNNAMKSESGRKNFCKFVNENKPEYDENKIEYDECESDECESGNCSVMDPPPENEKINMSVDILKKAKKYGIDINQEPEGQIIDNDSKIKEEMMQYLNNYGKDLLTIISTLSEELVDEWVNNYPYGMLLTDVTKGDGPKGLWLKVVLDRIEECDGKLEK